MQQETESKIAQTNVLLENKYCNMMAQLEGIQGYVCGMSTLQQENGELTEKQMRRLEILRNYKQNERAKGSYNPEEGIYDVIISNISLRENINGNPFIQLMCLNKDKKGCKRLYENLYRN